ncbi:MAG: hypothetical protein V1708_02250 [Candidatus Micrarchaeota archaeon]
MAEAMQPSALSSKEAYIEGRLEGLNELVKILSEAVTQDEQVQMNTLARSLIEHIASEMDEIIDEVKGVHVERRQTPPVEIKRAEAQVDRMQAAAKSIGNKTPEQAPKELKRHVEAADDLMKNLMALREERGGEQG